MKKTKRTKKHAKTTKTTRASKRAGATRFGAFYSRANGPAQELAAAADSSDALAKLRSFLRKHEPANREYQDGFHRNRVRAAQYELMRLEYLNGNVKAGDRLLAQLQDVDDR